MLILLACHGSGSASGTLTDARTGAPISAVEVVFTADAEGDCAEKTATTGADGAFSLPGLCAGKTYTVTPRDPLWWVDTPPEIPGGVEGSTVTLRAWRAPASDGIYLLDGLDLNHLLTQTAVTEALYAPSERTLRFPTELPETLPRVDGDKALVLSGPELLDRWRLEPTWDGPTLTLGPPDAAREVWPWTYIGARIREDGALEPMTVTPTAATDVGSGDRRVRYLTAASVPPGRYALTTPQGARALLLWFGDAAPTP